MIIVTGTKRSGTSMWMQILIAAGLEAFGEEFPRNWDQTIRDANPQGFFESVLRLGIHHGTNPHPVTGAYLFPDQVAHWVVKVFIPGLVRTDRAYIGKVVATVREWREYDRSVRRLFALEDENTEGPGQPRPPRMTPALEWWSENYALIRDIAVRRYPVHVQSYGGLLRDPGRVVRKTIEWIGLGDAEAAVAAVRPDHRTQTAGDGDTEPTASESVIEPEIIAVFDELYARIDRDEDLDDAFVSRLNDTQALLKPRIRQEQIRIMTAVQTLAKARRERRLETVREQIARGERRGGLGLHPGSDAPSGAEQIEYLLRRAPEIAYLPALEGCMFDPAPLPDDWPPPGQPLATLCDDGHVARTVAALDDVLTLARHDDNGGLEFLAATLRHFLTAEQVVPTQHPLIVSLYLRAVARKRGLPDHPMVITPVLDAWVS